MLGARRHVLCTGISGSQLSSPDLVGASYSRFFQGYKSPHYGKHMSCPNKICHNNLHIIVYTYKVEILPERYILCACLNHLNKLPFICRVVAANLLSIWSKDSFTQITCKIGSVGSLCMLWALLHDNNIQ